MGIHENFIGGGWTEASTAAPNVNPSNARDIVGEYARGTRDDKQKPRFQPGRGRTRRCGTRHSKRSRTRS
jgi:hypothetical protein